MPLDTQLTTHASTYAYTSPFYPAFYDHWITHLFDSGPPACTPLLTRLFPPTPNPVILDIGTGTGAIIRILPSSPAEVWAIDHSSSMLDRARKTTPGREVHWVETSATALPGELEGRVDLAVFAAGGVGHLVEREERVGFLRELRRVLKTGGLGVVSVLKEEGEFGEEQELVLESTEEAEVVYKKMPTVVRWEGDVRTDRFVVERWRGEEREWKGDCEWSLVRWEDGWWREEIEEAGLQVREVVEGEVESWWVLERKE
ncbi:S-adenosyl-L-methionine-dependent methyltransferase [Wilcoxina mikolae CBS 423.85]|nr:S-adenosyl-L-methionine-dependent methyltransferase [Wilcoxina mikolae CBS 423.85]